MSRVGNEDAPAVQASEGVAAELTGQKDPGVSDAVGQKSAAIGAADGRSAMASRESVNVHVKPSGKIKKEKKKGLKAEDRDCTVM